MAKDFFFVKYLIKSRLTDEIFLGYFFGKKGGKFEYDIVAILRRYFNPKVINLEESYFAFKKDFEKIKNEIAEKFPTIKELNRDVKNFLRIQIGKMGYDVFAKKIFKTVEDDDEGLLRMIIREMFENWTSRFELEMVYELIDYEVITKEMFSSSTDEKIIEQIYHREDLQGLPEVYPLIDPVEGVPIDEFQVGDKIFFTVLNPGNEETKNKLIEDFPRHFSKSGDNIMPFIGELLSKEIIPTVSKNYMLIKVDFGNGVIGKAVVLRSLRLVASEERLKGPVEAVIPQSVDEIINEIPQQTSSAPERIVKVSKEKQQLFTVDFFYGLLLALLFVALILLIAYYFF